MASKSSRVSIGIRKATKADLYSIQKERTAFNMPHPNEFVVQKQDRKQTTFIAFSAKTIVGFITVVHEENGLLTISDLYNRTGFEKKGIGSKLIGKVNAFAVKIGAKTVRLYPGSGFHLINGKKQIIFPNEFYEKKTNFDFQKRKKRLNGMEVTLENFFWDVKRKQSNRKKRTKLMPPKSIAPQNLMRKDSVIRRRK